MKLKSKWTKILIGSAMIAGPAVITIPLVITFSSVKEEKKWDSLSLIPESKYSPSPRIAKLFPEKDFNNIKDKIIFDFNNNFNEEASPITRSGPNIGYYRLSKKACSVQLIEVDGSDQFIINKVTEHQLLKDVDDKFKKGDVLTKVFIKKINFNNKTEEDTTQVYKNGKEENKAEPNVKAVNINEWFSNINKWQPPGFKPEPDIDVDDDYKPNDNYINKINAKDFRILKSNIVKEHSILNPVGSVINFDGVDLKIIYSDIKVKFNDTRFIIIDTLHYECINAPTTSNISIGQLYSTVNEYSFNLDNRVRSEKYEKYIDNKLIGEPEYKGYTMTKEQLKQFFEACYFYGQKPSTPEIEDNEKNNFVILIH